MFVQQSLLCFSIVVVVVTGQGLPGTVRLPPLEITQTVYWEIEIEAGGGFPKVLGNLTIGLFGKVVPLTVTNFVSYASSRNPGRMYLGRTFHRIIKGYLLQGGDLTGDDGESGFTDTALWFDSENFELEHVGAGWLSMANGGKKNGKDTNGSQFFITLAPTHQLDGDNVVFGKILSGMRLVRQMEKVETDDKDKPKRKIIITESKSQVLSPPLPTTLIEEAKY